MSKKPPTADSLTDALRAFQATRKTLQMATVSAEGDPLASYAPFVPGNNGEFFVFLSALAGHTRNLAVHPVASVLLIEDEATAGNLFARHRVSLRCDVKRLSRDDPDFDSIMAQFRQRFGAIVDTMIELPDFNLHALMPNGGSFIRGFGEAYTVVEGKVVSSEPRRPGAGNPTR